MAVLLEDDIDISRGDLIVGLGGRQPEVTQTISMMCCWFNPDAMQLNKRYIVKSTVAETFGMVKKIDYKVDVGTLGHISDIENLKMNDIARITLRTANPMVLDNYADNRTTGSLILIDPDNFETVGAGMVTATNH